MKALHGIFIIFCVLFTIASFIKSDWMTCSLFGLFTFLHVSQFFKPALEKPYKAEFKAV